MTATYKASLLLRTCSCWNVTRQGAKYGVVQHLLYITVFVAGGDDTRSVPVPLADPRPRLGL